MTQTFPSRLALLIVASVSAISLSFATVAFAQPAGGRCEADKQPCNGECIDEKYLCILEPLPGGPKWIVPSASPMDAFLIYVNNGVWQWAFRIGVAIAVLNGVAGGFQIVMSNGDSGKVDAGKNRFIGSAIGLIILLLSGTILEFLNPIGFQNG